MLLSVVIGGAPPAAEVGTLIRLAAERGWGVRAVPTPAAQSFVETSTLEALTGEKVEVGYRSPDARRPPRPDALIVAPATFNTVNKAALGLADTHALGVIAECIGRGIPVVVVPWVNEPLAAREPFRRSLAQLAGEGVRVILDDSSASHGGSGPGPRPYGVTSGEISTFPWKAALEATESLAHRP